MSNLFNRLTSLKTLQEAWKVVKTKNTSGGIDGVTVSEFEKKLNVNLEKLRENLVNKSWTPQPYMRITIPKKSGEYRKLGLLAVC